MDYHFAKRLFDICFSAAVLTLLSPLFLLIALLIKLDSNGPVFYAGARLGQNFTIFSQWKFRTMYIDADRRLDALLQDESIRKRWESHRKIDNDPRITRVGAILRKTSLDELPQFYNALLGDLSIVGPRPHLVTEVINSRLCDILSVKPGITGLWQTSGRNLLSFCERLDLETEYVRRKNFILDCRLILKTLPLFFLTKGAS